MAVNRSQVSHIVQQAASRMNLSLETEQEIMESLQSESVNDVWQLHHITFERWKAMGAPVGFLASLESCLQEAGFGKDGKVKAKKKTSGKSSGRSTPRSSGNASKAQIRNGSGRSTVRQRNGSRSSSRDSASLAASTDNPSSSSLASMSSQKVSSESRKAALRELRERLRAQSKQGQSNAQFDAKGSKVYDWDQNDSCVLLYVVWPFDFEFGPDTKFKCTISKDTVLLKGKYKDAQRSLRFTTGALVNALHSEWCVVSKGNASNGSNQMFAIEIVLIKKKVGFEWGTALIAKHIGTNHMSPDQIRDELRSYGLDPSSYRSKDELLKALRMARVKGNSNFSALGPNARKAPGRSHSVDDVQLFGNSEDTSSPRSSSNSKRSRRARSNSNDRPLITESNVNKFSEGQIVYYTSSDGKNERAKILKIHLDDALVPFFDIRLTESGKEKQTDDAHLSRLTDQLFLADSSPPESTSAADVSTGSNQVPKQSRFVVNQVVFYTNNGQKEKAKILSIHLDDELVPFYDIRLAESGLEKQTTDSRLSNLTDDLFKAAAAAQDPGLATSISPAVQAPDPSQQIAPDRSKSCTESGPSPAPIVPKSRFMENQVVYYTNNGEKEKAKILSIHFDDELVPFYDIRLVESGTEKQTTDSRLSSLTDDLFKAAAHGRVRCDSVGSELPVSPQKKLPGRSRSMGSSDAVPSLSPGPLKKGRRPDRRPPSSKMPSATTVPTQPPALARAISDDSQMPNRGNNQAPTVPKSRFMENQVVYYTNNGEKEKAKILSIHFDDELVPFYDIRLVESGTEKQTTDSRLSSLTDDLFKAAAQGRVRCESVGSELPVSPQKKLPGRSRSMGSSDVVPSMSPGPLKKGRRPDRRPPSSKMPSGGTVPTQPQAPSDKKSRFMENQIVYYSSNGQKEKAKILKIHLDDELVPFYDIRLLDSGKEKQTTDSHVSSLTADLFKTSGQSQERDRSTTQAQGQVRRGSVGPGLHISPERKLPDRSRSFDAAGVAGVAVSQSPGPLRKGRKGGRRQSLGGAPQTSASNIANIKKGLAGYGAMSPNCYKYANEGEMREAWKIIQADSKLSVGRLKKELRDLGQSTEYIEKNEMIGGLCKTRLDKKAGRIDNLGGSDRAAEGPSSGGPARKTMQRRNSDGPLSMLKKGKRRGARGK